MNHDIRIAVIGLKGNYFPEELFGLADGNPSVIYKILSDALRGRITTPRYWRRYSETKLNLAKNGGSFERQFIRNCQKHFSQAERTCEELMTSEDVAQIIALRMKEDKAFRKAVLSRL